MRESLFENLLKKPPHYKRTVAFFTALSFTALIFSFWLFGTFTGEGGFVKKNESVARKGPSPISTMKKNFGQLLEIPRENVSRGVSEIRSVLVEILSEDLEEPLVGPQKTDDATEKDGFRSENSKEILIKDSN